MEPVAVSAVEAYEWQALGCHALGSPFYGVLLDQLAADARAGGPSAAMLMPFAHRPLDDALPLRLLGGVHRLVLEGGLPELAARYPSAGGDGDAERAWAALRAVLVDPPVAVTAALESPPQTNEVGRAASLGAGIAVVAYESGLPLRLFELGTSAGLNLRLDRFHYETANRTAGDLASPVRFDDLWDEGEPPFSPGVEVVERFGCDRSPIDPTTPAGRLTLLSYDQPDQPERFARSQAAIEVARRVPATIERADIPRWLEERLDLATGTATVVFHSITWQYLEPDDQDRVRRRLAAVGARTDERSPLAWLRLEPAQEPSPFAELRLTTWPGGQERLLATSGFHAGRVRWLMPATSGGAPCAGPPPPAG